METDKGDDKLGVDADARAFARLILDKDVHPPLSIGLLGDWGSSKSFFIEQIKKGVAELIEEGRPELYSQVVEIEFNAWHASDSNLWASLVTNIFDAIWENVSPPDKRRDPKAARERLQKEIEQARGAVHEAETQVQLGQQALEMAEIDLKQKREMLAWNNYVKSFASEKLRSLVKNAGWHESLETINDVQNAARALAASGNRLRTIASALLEKPLLYIATPAALLLAMTVAVETEKSVSLR
jgi:predicted KAP-like P-loop ATPase